MKAFKILSCVVALAISTAYLPMVNAFAASNKPTVSKVTVGYTSYEYKGKAVDPKALYKDKSIVVGSNKKTLTYGTDYTVSYKNNKSVGVATVTVTGKGDYTGNVSKNFIIKPAKNVITSTTATYVNASKGKIVVNYIKGTPGTVGYQVLYSKNKSALNKADGEVKQNDPYSANYVHSTSLDKDTTRVTLSKYGKPGETWYIKVRSYYTIDGKTTSTRYGNYSIIKTVTIPSLPLNCTNKTINIDQRATNGGLNGYICSYYGCGPTSLAMVLVSEKGYDIGNKTSVLQKGWNAGLYFSGTTQYYANHYGYGLGGISVKQLKALANLYYSNQAVLKKPNANELATRLKTLIKQGHRVIIGHHNGKFNHYAVVYGYEGNNFKISDPQFGYQTWGQSTIESYYNQAMSEVRGIVYYK